MPTSCSNIRNTAHSAHCLRSDRYVFVWFVDTHTAIIFLYHNKVVLPFTEHKIRSMWEMERCGSVSNLEQLWSAPFNYFSTNTSKIILNRETCDKQSSNGDALSEIGEHPGREVAYVHYPLSFSEGSKNVIRLAFRLYTQLKFCTTKTEYLNINQINITFHNFNIGSKSVKWIFMNDFNFVKHITWLKIMISCSMLVPAPISYSNIGSKSDYNVCPGDRFFARYWFLSKTFFYVIERRNFCQAEYHEFHPRKKISFYSCQPWHNVYWRNINVFRWVGITHDRIRYCSVIYIKPAGQTRWKFNGKSLYLNVCTCWGCQTIHAISQTLRVIMFSVPVWYTHLFSRSQIFSQYWRIHCVINL